MALTTGPTMTQQIRVSRAFGGAPASGPHPCQQAGVILLQSMLNAYFDAHALTEDGVFGLVTRSWMQRYQRENQLAVTNLPNEPTLRRLGITTMVSDVIQHARLSSQCLARQAGTATSGGGGAEGSDASGGTDATGVSVERIDGGTLPDRLRSVPWYWWVAGVAVVAGGAAFGIGALKGKKRGR